MKNFAYASWLSRVMWAPVVMGFLILASSLIYFADGVISLYNIPFILRMVILSLIGIKIVVDVFISAGVLTHETEEDHGAANIRVVISMLLAALMSPFDVEYYFTSFSHVAFFVLVNILVVMIFLIISIWIWEKILK